MDRPASRSSRSSALARWTVLDLAAQGLSQRAIATRLGVARSTVARAVARHIASEPPVGEPASHQVDHTLAHLDQCGSVSHQSGPPLDRVSHQGPAQGSSTPAHWTTTGGGSRAGLTTVGHEVGQGSWWSGLPRTGPGWP